MKKEYLKLHREFKKIFYDFNKNKWFENIEEFFDSYFYQRFEVTKNLGNKKRYENFKIFYELLLLDFGSLCLENNIDFVNYQKQLIKNRVVLLNSIKKSDIDILTLKGVFKKEEYLAKDFFNQCVFYQLMLMLNFIFRLSNIESLQRNVDYEDLKGMIKTLHDTVNKKPYPAEPHLELKSKNLTLKKNIIQAINEIIEKGEKPLKSKVFIWLKNKGKYTNGNSNFYEACKEYAIAQLFKNK